MLKPETLKVIAGASIVITAFGLMLHSVMGYVFSLARLGLIILIALVVSSGVALTWQFLIKRSKNPSENESSANNASNTEST